MSIHTIPGKKRALLPLFMFVATFMGAGIYHHHAGTDYAFYQLPAPVAIIPAIILAFLIARTSLTKTLDQFTAGVGQPNIITMCLIYLLAGAFSSLAKATGGVDATLALGMTMLPEQTVLPGLFILTAFIATAMGTSMGTLAAMAPIGLGMTQTLGVDSALIAGILLSGAMFGDNLSIISDTSIAATRTQEASVRGKFLANARLALPAAFVLVVILSLQPVGSAALNPTDASPWLALPYVLVIVLAVIGVNVFVVLLCGILFCVLMGMWVSDYSIGALGSDIYTGFTQMQEIFILSLLIGGLSELMRQQGGLSFVVQSITTLSARWVKRPEVASQLSIASLAAATNLCVANNTVAIIVCGDAVKAVAKQNQLSPARAACLLDISACILQGVLPYGAQMLLIGAAFGLSPLTIVPYVWYCFLLSGITLVSMLFWPGAGHEPEPLL